MELYGGGETGFLRVSIKIILNEYFLLSWEIGTHHIFHLFCFTESWLNIRYLYSVRMWLYLYIHTKNMRNTWSGTTALDIIREKKKSKKELFSWPSQNIPILPSNNCCSAGICPRIEGIEWSFENFYYPHISVKEVPKQK